MALKGQSGGSLGGRTIRINRTPENNKRKCRVCKSHSGKPCVTRQGRILMVTHASAAVDLRKRQESFDLHALQAESAQKNAAAQLEASRLAGLRRPRQDLNGGPLR